MADFTPDVRSDRWLDEVVLTGTIANVDGERSDTLILPAGIGDVAIMEAVLFVANIATPIASDSALGALLQIINPAGTVVDFVGVAAFKRASTATLLAAYWSPDPLVLWQQNERLSFLYPELDTNASPTGDASVRVKVVHVRPVAGAPSPIRLVR